MCVYIVYKSYIYFANQVIKEGELQQFTQLHQESRGGGTHIEYR